MAYFLLIFTFGMIIFTRAIGREESQTPAPSVDQAVPLELLATFPGEEQESKGVYLRQGAAITCDPERNRIYIVDSMENCILVFDFEFRYVKTIGKEGQGPGEMENPLYIALNSDLNFMSIREGGNRRIDLFNLAGDFIKSFPYQKSGMGIGILPSGDILQPVRSDDLNEPLVLAFDQEGKIKQGFGKRIDFGENTRSLNETLMSVNREGYVVLAYNEINKVVVFDREGKPIVDRALPSKEMDEAEKYNIKSKYDPATGSQRFRTVIAGVFATSKAVYVSRYFPELKIFQIDYRGDVKAVFSYPEEKDYIGGRLCVDEKSGRIYVIQNYPESNVQVFRLPAKSPLMKNE